VHIIKFSDNKSIITN